MDLAVVHKKTHRRTLATVKWSVRADREERFEVDFDAYARMEVAGEPFNVTFVTNEFDAARLVAACNRRHAGRPPFDRIVHNLVVPKFTREPDEDTRRVEHMRKSIAAARERLQSEIKDLGRRGNLNLVIGATTTLAAVFVLG